MTRGPTRNLSKLAASDFNRILCALEIYVRIYPERKGYRTLIERLKELCNIE